ncbi:MAG: family 10 glycosylhydrolase [Ignavibacteriales bacterium]|nr:family 10 glycosylhydrolase [Ignavibacteriales bacterium]
MSRKYCVMQKIVMAVFCAAVCVPVLQSQPLEEFRAAKLTNVDSNVLFADQNIADAMDYLASIGINVVLPVVWNGAYTQYQSSVMDSIFGKSIHPQFAGRDPLDRVIIEAHRVGIEVYPWFEYGFAAWYSGTSFPRGGPILAKFPSWSLRSIDGQICNKNGFDWMNAVNPDVQKFINALIAEVITKYDTDGLEFSDRIPAMPVEGGYDSVMVAIYKNEHGGSTPPSTPSDPEWMRWRADKMNQWYAGVRTMMKKQSSHLFVSSSPSQYPWSYQEYLQDSYNWLAMGIPDHYIPQLYRYSFSDYYYEFTKALDLVGSRDKQKLFPGILMNVGTGSSEYVMTPEFLLQVMKTNRDNGINGEAFFYYEGLRKNNNRLGDTLKATYYRLPAIVPDRGHTAWRPPAIVLNEDDPGASASGSWELYTMRGFKGGILRTADTLNPAAVKFSAAIPATASYDVYTYRVPNTPWTKLARYVLYSDKDSAVVIVDQSDLTKRGWYKLGTISLQAGAQSFLKLDNSRLEPGRYLVTDAVMLMVNRKLSPDARLTAVHDRETKTVLPDRSDLMVNYPNPFNPNTTLSYVLAEACHTTLRVHDVMGREVAMLVNADKPAGRYSVTMDASRMASGVYFYTLSAGSFLKTRKMLLVR